MRADVNDSPLRIYDLLIFPVIDSFQEILNYFSRYSPEARRDGIPDLSKPGRSCSGKCPVCGELLNCRRFSNRNCTEFRGVAHTRASVIRHSNHRRRRKCKREFAPIGTARPSGTSFFPWIPFESRRGGYASYPQAEPLKDISIYAG
jgi:hypothetical protein